MQVQIIESNRGGKIALPDGHSFNQTQSTIKMQKIRSTYELDNAVPYLRAVAKFR